MTKEEQLKAIILTKYKSINAFAVSLNISPSTINSVLRRGIDGASIQVMLKVFDALDLDIESARTDTLKEKKKDPPRPAICETEGPCNEGRGRGRVSRPGYYQAG